MKTTIDIICVGEVLIDLIGHEIANLEHTKDFHRILGGSPTNVAINGARLGLKTALVATCGNDKLGDYIIEELQKNKVITTQVKKSYDNSTSAILVSRSLNTPDFIPYREADKEITEDQIPDELLQKTKIFHTSCFALSKEPARTAILNSAYKAKSMGLQLSIDLNYSEKIWPNRKEAIQVLSQYLATDPWVKVSEDDCFRLFEETKSEAFIFDYFHNLGVSTICLTKGKNGVNLSDRSDGVFQKEVLPVQKIKDATGAGDAFWTGFLFAKLNNKNSEQCLAIAQSIARVKLKNIGQLPEDIDLEMILKETL